jgi:hypothetical protein
MRDDAKADNGPLSALQLATAEAAERSAPQHETCQGHLARKVIAAFRRGGVDCCVVLTEGDTLH